MRKVRLAAVPEVGAKGNVGVGKAGVNGFCEMGESWCWMVMCELGFMF